MTCFSFHLVTRFFINSLAADNNEQYPVRQIFRKNALLRVELSLNRSFNENLTRFNELINIRVITINDCNELKCIKNSLYAVLNAF